MSYGDDGFAILNLINLVANARDDHDRERLASYWTEDGVFARAGWPNDGVPISGRDNVVSFLLDPGHAGDWGAKWFGGVRAVKHLCLNPAIRIDGDEASAVTDVIILGVVGDPASGGCEARATGRYADQFRREDGRWLLSRRTIIAQIPDLPEECAAAAQDALAAAAARLSA